MKDRGPDFNSYTRLAMLQCWIFVEPEYNSGPLIFLGLGYSLNLTAVLSTALGKN